MKLSAVSNYPEINAPLATKKWSDSFQTVQINDERFGEPGHGKESLVSVELIHQHHAERKATEDYIADKFAQVHQAHIDHFLPCLISVKHADQRLAAIGLQAGNVGKMFLEQYLSSPVEQQIACLEKQPVSREHIVEIGNLVVSHKPAGFMLFLIIASALSHAGFKWMTFTATPAVEEMIRHLGYTPFYLAEARADCLGEAAQQWGHYYAKQPRVLVGNIEDAQAHIKACASLSKLIKPKQTEIKQLAAEILSASKRR